MHYDCDEEDEKNEDARPHKPADKDHWGLKGVDPIDLSRFLIGMFAAEPVNPWRFSPN